MNSISTLTGVPFKASFGLGPITSFPSITNPNFSTDVVGGGANSQITVTTTTNPITGWTWATAPDGGTHNSCRNIYDINPSGGGPSSYYNSSYETCCWLQQSSGSNTMTLSQVLNFTQAGYCYVTYIVAPRYSYYNSTQSLKVTMDGTQIGGPYTFTTSGTFTGSILYKSNKVSISTTGNHTLAFVWTQTATNDSTIMITGISLSNS